VHEYDRRQPGARVIVDPRVHAQATHAVQRRYFLPHVPQACVGDAEVGELAPGAQPGAHGVVQRGEQGGSTITQQLVKSYFLTDAQTYSRKLKEAVMAVRLEQRFGKAEILNAYVNEVYLGQDGERAVHGFGLGSSYLVPLAARLGRHAHVYAPDLPGHGLSEHDERGLKVPELASALAAFMDASRMRSAVLVGHSLGCAVVAELAARRPDLAVGVVLVSPASDPAVRRKPGEQLRRALRASWHERPTFAFWAAADARRAGRTVLATELQELNEHRIEDVLPDVRAPVRVVRGEHDALVPQRWAEAIARLVDAPSPTVIPGWGHAVNYDAPDALVKVVFSLVRSLTQAASTVKPVVGGDADAPIPHGVRPPADGGAASATVH